MYTEIYKIKHHVKEDGEALQRAADLIRGGSLVAFPTETVYGLGADALNPLAAKKIYEAKGRPSDNPLIAHISSIEEMYALVESVDEKTLLLAKTFWPGPLTLILKKSAIVPDTTSGGLDTVAIRMPDSLVARELIRLSKTPIAAPSANTSGKPSPTLAIHVYEDLAGKIEMILDDGGTDIGLESTILDMTGEIPVLLRPGAITKTMIEACIGTIDVDKAILEKPVETIIPKAPGMKYTHYAPKADMALLQGVDVETRIINLAKKALQSGKKVGLLLTKEHRGTIENKLCHEGIDQNVHIETIGTLADLESVAHSLFAKLRIFDTVDVDMIYAESFLEDGIGMAIMNRMKKAAGYKILDGGEDER